MWHVTATQVKKLKASIQKLKAENEGYRQDNKAAEFEAQLQASSSSLLSQTQGQADASSRTVVLSFQTLPTCLCI